MNKIFSLFIVGIFLISLVSASDLGTFKQGECISLYQFCDDCTYVNLTTVQNPNGTIQTFNIGMTKNGVDYNYTYCDTDSIGVGYYTTKGDKGGDVSTERLNFEITGTGFEFNLQRTFLSFGMLFILIFLFIISLIVIPKIPSGNKEDDYGNLIGISKLKYLRPILYVVAYLLLMSIVFTGSNLSLAYLGTTLLGDLLYKIFYVMMALALPMLIIWFIFLFYNIFQDKKLKEYIERGLINERLW